ncbi:MAG: citrate synthase [Deltaproteobacteria bacterium]|nr:MAG: citrate synthase [Deltaproteobacteria bacterium]
MTETTYSKGLAGVIAAESTICKIDGDKGLLSYRGYTIQDLAENSNFSESAYLLLYGALPTAAQLASFEETLLKYRVLDDALVGVLQALPRDTHPMIALQTVAGAHGSLSPVPAGHSEANVARSIELIAKFPLWVAAWARIKEGKDVIAPRADLGHGQNFLYMLDGDVPDEETGHIFDVCLILHMEHSFNASTFTARVVAATEAPIDASVSAAVGALYGPLHGGANERVLDQLETIPSVEATEQWVMDSLAQKRKVMGMGHRVYRAKDPRSYVLEGFLKTIAEKRGTNDNYEKLKVVESTMDREMRAKNKPIYPNVDFFSGSLYELLGIGTEHFTPIFAIARVVGWTAHILEQWEDNRIYRPKALYTGETSLSWKPVGDRG